MVKSTSFDQASDILSHQILKLLRALLVSALLTFVPAFVSHYGAWSMFLTPSGSALTVILCSTLLILLRRAGSRRVKREPLVLPPTAELAMIIFACFTIVVYLAALAILLMFIIIISWDGELGFEPQHGSMVAELIMVLVDVALLVTVVVRCIQQRRLLKRNASAWHQLDAPKLSQSV